MKLIIQTTKGIVRDHHARRWAMFVLVAAALVMLFAGSTFLGAWLSGEPLFFLLYWAACAWLTFSAVLLALFDMLAMRAAARREREQLKQKIFGDYDKEG